MNEITQINEINEILEDVSQSWLAADGGLTWAAGGLIQFGRSVIRHIEAGDAEWCWGLDGFNTDTGAEAEIICLAQSWARTKIRRQIEDRLRKDSQFFEAVADLFHNGGTDPLSQN